MTEVLQTILPITKLLLDEDRLKILGYLAIQSADVSALGQVLRLKPKNLMRHLDQLEASGLVEKLPSQTYQFQVNQLHALKKEIFALESGTVQDLTPEEKTLRAFVDDDRLKSIPVKRRSLLIVLAWLVTKFEVDARYPEKEINAIIQNHHPDYAALRRALVDHAFMTRERGIYWRVKRV